MLVRQGLYTTLQDQFDLEVQLSQSQKVFLLCQILLGLQEVHSHGLYHGDLKASNVLLTRES